MATTPLQLIKKVWERFVTEMLTCRALQQVVDGSSIRRASTPSGRRKRFEQDSLKKSWIGDLGKKDGTNEGDGGAGGRGEEEGEVGGGEEQEEEQQ